MKVTGERQVSQFFSEVRKDHRERYNLVLDHVQYGDTILDIGCGIGYGSFFLATMTPCLSITAVDLSEEAIEYAREHYRHGKINFIRGDALKINLDAKYDIIIAYEITEHIENASDFLKRISLLLKPEGKLFVSTPNEEIMPYSKERFPFHVRHYSSAEFENLLIEAGLFIEKRFSQINHIPFPGFGGNYNIAVCTNHVSSMKGFGDSHECVAKILVNLDRFLNLGKFGEKDISFAKAELMNIFQEMIERSEQTLLFYETLEKVRSGDYEKALAIMLEDNGFDRIRPEDQTKRDYYIGTTYEKIGRFNEGIRYLKKAEENRCYFDDELTGLLYYHMAFCLDNLNRQSEALTYYYRCLDLISNHEKAADRIKKLTS